MQVKPSHHIVNLKTHSIKIINIFILVMNNYSYLIQLQNSFHPKNERSRKKTYYVLVVIFGLSKYFLYFVHTRNLLGSYLCNIFHNVVHVPFC
jgi:hypothetical protein